MRSGILPFFATSGDLKTLLESIDELHPIRLVRGGLLDQPLKDKLPTSKDLIPRSNYLVINMDDFVQEEAIPQRRGGVKYALDLHLNPRAVGLFTGELIGTEILLPGQFGTLKGTSQAIGLFDAISAVTRKTFTKVKSYYLGSQAVRLLDSGCRLAASVKGDPLYDLRRI